MATFFERTEELCSLFGWGPVDLYTALNLDKSTYSRWKTGAAANREALLEMSRRFLVSVDSLMALDGTASLEPSPVLRKAHTLLLDGIQKVQRSPDTAVKRLELAYELLQATGCGLTIETWAAYLRTTVGGWLEVRHGHKPATEDNLAGAAHLLGWYDLRGAWLHWLSTGSLDRIKGPSEESLIRTVRRMRMMGIVEAEVLETMERHLAERNSFTEKQ